MSSRTSSSTDPDALNDAHGVTCPTCGSGPGTLCTSAPIYGGNPANGTALAAPHSSRITAARSERGSE